ncbi:hypothetical protein [Devosia sp. 2618]|uniref:hypothetical protein n=1 Tax=Devosia sp. 2618 TaxID=3156454 RepID=UPI003395FAD5
MMMVSVDKYVEGKRETGFSVPVGLVRVMSGLLPAAARRGLAGRGIYVDEMIAASTNEAPFSRWVNVTEHGVEKAIKLTVHN